jgi:L-Ala-D/L-Glu epimerase
LLEIINEFQIFTKLQLLYHDYTLQLRHPFKIARDEYSTREVVIVELREGGLFGLGEAITNAYYKVTVSEIHAKLEAVRTLIENTKYETPDQFWSLLQPQLSENPFVLNALDCAFSDIWAKKMGKPLYKTWDLSLKKLPQSNYTIGIDTIEKMILKIEEMPWPLYKIKLGTPNDIEIIEKLRQVTKAKFRVDANCGWTVEETLQNAKELKKLGVQFIEQPLKPDNWEGMAELFVKSKLPLVADESCQNEKDVVRCHQHFHAINIKLVKCGGLTPARRMITESRKLGLKVMVGCMTESSVGISAIGHLLPLLDYVDMDGALLLKNDIATGVTLRDGKAYFPKQNGVGASLLVRSI